MYNYIYNQKQINLSVQYDCNLEDQQRILQDCRPSYTRLEIRQEDPSSHHLNGNS